MPNEYVAACVEGFRVRCLVGENNNGIDETPQYLVTNRDGGYFTTDSSLRGKRDNDHGVTSGCGNADSQILTKSSNNTWGFEEKGVFTYPDATITNPVEDMALTWTTSITNTYGTRYYHHKGKIVDWVSSNHS